MTQLEILEQQKQDKLNQVNVLLKEHNTKYSNICIEAPMGEEEKALKMLIADIFSEINEIVRQKKIIIKASKINHA